MSPLPRSSGGHLVLLGVATVGTALSAATPSTAPATRPSSTPTFVSGIVTLADGVTPLPKVIVTARPVEAGRSKEGGFGFTDDDAAAVGCDQSRLA